MALNSLNPSDTALEMATLSAQMPKVREAFSTLHPRKGTSVAKHTAFINNL